jgi:hypothetical protein
MLERDCLSALHRLALGTLVLAGSLTGPRVVHAQAPGDTLSLYRHDLVAPLDPNGFLLNPRWLHGVGQTPDTMDPRRPPDIDQRCRFRAASGTLGARFLLTTRGPCLSGDELQLVSLNETPSPLGAGFVCSTNSLIGDIHGHVNWFPATVTGQLRWAGYSALPGDQDLSLDLGNTPEPNALTSGNPRPEEFGRRPAYRVEFSHPETLQRLIDGGSDAVQAWWSSYGDSLSRVTQRSRNGQSWWAALFDAYDHDAAMRRLVNGRVAVVTGLVGLDAVHGFQTELHPAYALFVLIDTTRSANGLREEWAFMIRNLGNQGDCSYGTLPMVTSADSIQDFSVNLGEWNGAGAPRAYLGPTWSTDSSRVPTVASDTVGGNLLISLRHPRPTPDGRDFLTLGTIYIEWTRDGTGSPLARFYGSSHPWLRSPSVRIKLDSLPWPVPPRRSRLGDATEILELPGAIKPSAFEDVLAPMRPRALRVTDSVWTPPETITARRTVPLFAWMPATRGCALAGADPICSPPMAFFTVAADAFDDLFFSPVYLYSRVLRICSDECVIGQVLGALAYRLDLSGDRFRHSCVALPCTPRVVPGWSARVSPILTGTPFRLGKGASLIPYTVGSVGVSFLVGQRASPLLAVGFGLRLHTGYFDLFGEGQDNVRTAGRYENRWKFPVGVHLDLANLLR